MSPLRYVVFVAALTGGAAMAQTLPDGLRLTTVDPPRGAESAAYRDDLSGQIKTDATYATEVSGGSLTSDSRPPVRRRAQAAPQSIDLGGWMPLVIVAVLAAVLLGWMRFAGGGILSSAPRNAKPKKQAAPETWDLSSSQGLTGEALLNALGAMTDRRAAMVQLLRHCLLHAAETSDTQLARSDTERQVFARLPQNYPFSISLAQLLQQTELAHYGGREPGEAVFQDSISRARALLTSRGAQAHVHG